MPHPGVVVTAAGIWSAAGISVDSAFARALSGEPAARVRDLGGIPTPVCTAPDPPCAELPQARHMDRAARLALAAARQAYSAAALGGLDPARIAVIVGSSRGPAGKWSEPAGRRIRPSQAIQTTIGSISGAVALALRALGPSLTVSATCASAAHAIALAAILIRSGAADAVLAGGAEAPLVPAVLRQCEAAGILSMDPEHGCRPFDIRRDGTVAGEGAGFLVLESAGHAQRRGAPVLARVAGASMVSEGHTRAGTHPEGAGLQRAMRAALEEAGLEPAAIGHVNAHGTGTPVNDAAEAAALRALFGDAVRAVPVCGTKAVTGHTFGASAALEAIFTIESLRRGVVPPTAGCERPDPALGIDVVHGAPRRLEARWALSNSLGFWGNVASLIFERPGDPAASPVPRPFHESA